MKMPPKGIATSNKLLLESAILSLHKSQTQCSVPSCSLSGQMLSRSRITSRQCFFRTLEGCVLIQTMPMSRLGSSECSPGLALFQPSASSYIGLYLLYGVGGSFKSGFQRIIEKSGKKGILKLQCHPMEWDQDYKKAANWLGS
jgi:hypothetical protein